MNENSGFSMDISGVQGWRIVIKVAAYLVYLAGVLFATITFSTHISDQFPDQPLLRAMAFAGAWANFFSLGIMPLAKEYWISGRAMTGAAWVFWVAEFMIIVFNTLAAYSSEWATWWTPLSPASPVFVVAVWGLIWYLNPEAKAHQEQVNFYLTAQKDFQDKLRTAMKSQVVQDIMRDGAAQAAQQFAENSLGVVIDTTHKPRKSNAKKIDETSGTGNGYGKTEAKKVADEILGGAGDASDPNFTSR